MPTANGAIPHFSNSSPTSPTGQRNANIQQGSPYSGTLVWNGITYSVQFTDISWNFPNIGQVDARTTTTETIGLASQGKLVTLSNAGAIAVTLDSTAPNYFLCFVSVIGAGSATLAPSSGTINGASNLVLSTGQSTWLFFNGTNWWAGPALGGDATRAGVQQEAYTYASDTGAANAYAVSLSPAPTLVAGSMVQFKAANANTGASTLAVNGGAAKSIKKSGGTALASGDIASGQIIFVIYDGTNFQLIGSSAGFTAGGDLSGTSSSQTVIGLEGKPLDATTVGSPSDGQAIVWSAASSKYIASSVPTVGLPTWLADSPDAPPATAGSLDDEFFSTLSGSWTQTNIGSTTVSSSKSYLRWTGVGPNGINIRRITKAAPSTPWTVTARVIAMPPFYTPSTSGINMGLGIEDGSGKIILFVCSATNSVAETAVTRYTNQTTFSAGSATSVWPFWMPMYLQINDDGANLNFSQSSDGVTFVQINSQSRTAFFASGPTKVGIYWDNESNGFFSALDVDWFRSS